MAGQAPQAAIVSAKASAASPSQAWASPQRSSSGARVPDAAMPKPTPVNTTPLASPRRAGGTWDSTEDGARIISTPPHRPDSSRQPKNQAKGSRTEQAASATTTASIAPRSTGRMPNRATAGRASSAPPR